MKKVMILIGVAALAIASQAASFKWTAANIYASDLTTKYTGTAAIYAYLSTDTVDSAVKVVDVDIVDGSIKNGSVSGYTYEWADASVGSNYRFYMVIEDGEKTFSSDSLIIKEGSAQATSTTTISFANMASATQDASNWSAVPEPTSAMLLVLGVAALVLRRKRA